MIYSAHNYAQNLQNRFSTPFLHIHVGFAKCPKNFQYTRYLSRNYKSWVVARTFRWHIAGVHGKKEGKENPSCTITLTSLARPISFSRRACNSFRQFFCRRTRENSGSRNYRDAADPTRPGNRAKINANPSNLSSAMTKGRRRHTINRENREKKRWSQWTAFEEEGKRSRQFFSLVSMFSLSISPDLIFALQHLLLFFVHLFSLISN